VNNTDAEGRLTRPMPSSTPAGFQLICGGDLAPPSNPAGACVIALR